MRTVHVVVGVLALVGLLAAGPATAVPGAVPEAVVGGGPAGGACVKRLHAPPEAVAAIDPVGVLVPCPGIQPGAFISIDGGGCTMNFLFRGTSYDEDGNPVDEGLFVGSAGHCYLLGNPGEEVVFERGKGPEARDAEGRRIGELAYAVLIGVNPDFALVRIDPERDDDVVPGLCHFGGPTGMAQGAAVGDLVHHFGQGTLFGDTVPGRSGVVGDTSVPGRTGFAGAAFLGDSGSPVIHADGRALGVVVGLDVTPVPAMQRVTNLAPQLERASQVMEIDFALLTAPLR